MNKDQVEGKAKEMKPAEGKVQNAWGNANDASHEPARESVETDISDEDEKERLRRQAG